MKRNMEIEGDNKSHGGIAAFFDLDGTLMALPSLERRFFNMLRYRNAIPAGNYLRWLKEAVGLAPRGIGTLLQANKMYLHGLAPDRWGSAGLRLAPTFFERGLETMAWHGKQAHSIVLMSGTLEPLARDVSPAIEANLAARGVSLVIRVCATRLEEMDGLWTGRILGEAMYGRTKAHAAKKIALEMGLDLAHCYAYGDSFDDQWLLAAVGRPSVINPLDELARLARMRGWPVLNWRGKENSTQRRKGPSEIAEKRELPRLIA